MWLRYGARVSADLRTSFFASFLVGIVGGCTCDPTNYERLEFACTTDADCSSGNSCVGGICRTSGTGDGGVAGGAAGGGASMGGGLAGGDAGGATGGGDGGGGNVGGGSAGGTAGGSTVDAGCMGNAEVCGDQVDDNCNGILDDGCPCVAPRPCYPGGLSSSTLRFTWDGGGGCSAGAQACVGNVYGAACENAHVPQLEFCDGQDTDCDGLPDPPNCPCQTGRACFQGSPFIVGIGACRQGVWNCAMPPGQQCVGQVLPAVGEICNGIDDDCNGQVDENVQTSPCGPGVCASANRTCSNGAEVACSYTVNPPSGYALNEVCGDGLDNECDGQVDDGCTCTISSSVSCWTGSSAACPPDGGVCLGVCRRGMQTCAALSDGGTGFGACGGQTMASIESCTDTTDNDCDGRTDCADSDCSGRACGTNGLTCSAGACRCLTVDGGVGPAAETTCNDAFDNDCDGLVDCAEAACAGSSCGAFGKACVGTTCACVVDGGMSQMAEVACADGRDNDCDGLIDCAEIACGNQACGANGLRCSGGTCRCLLPDAGAGQLTETTCNDGLDNDCDGQIDCLDPNCATAANCMMGVENCSDGMDNDGDMAIDCADSQCFHKVCGPTSASICCGTSCTLLTSPTNCGQCGLTCLSGSSCLPVGSGTHLSGTCSCPSGLNSQCPRPSGFSAQTCVSNQCTCDSNDDRCGNAGSGQGSRCISAAIDYCHYQ